MDRKIKFIFIGATICAIIGILIGSGVSIIREHDDGTEIEMSAVPIYSISGLILGGIAGLLIYLRGISIIIVITIGALVGYSVGTEFFDDFGVFFSGVLGAIIFGTIWFLIKGGNYDKTHNITQNENTFQDILKDIKCPICGSGVDYEYINNFWGNNYYCKNSSCSWKDNDKDMEKRGGL
jgi:nitrogen fixation-related uncharacterized protein